MVKPYQHSTRSFNSNGAETNETLPAEHVVEAPGLSDVQLTNLDVAATSPGHDNINGAYKGALRRAERLGQLAVSSLISAAETTRKKFAAREAQKLAQKREKDLERLRAGLLAFDPTWKPPVESANPVRNRIAETPRPHEAPAALPENVHQQEIGQRNVEVRQGPYSALSSAQAELQQTQILLRKAQAEIKRRAQENQVEHEARIKAEQERDHVQTAFARVEDLCALKTAQAEAHQRATTKVEKELQVAELARVQAEEEAKIFRETQAEQGAKLKAAETRQLAELARLKLENENIEAARATLEQQLNIQIEQQRQQLEQARLRFVEDISRKAQVVEVEQQARIKAEEKNRQVELALLKAKEDAEQKAKAVESEHQARIQADKEREQAELALAKALKELETKAQEVETEQQARIRANDERQQVDFALQKAEEEISRKAQEARAEHEARIKIEQELQLAERARSVAEKRKGDAIPAGQTTKLLEEARIKADEQLQQTLLALEKAEQEAEKKTREALAEHEARVVAEEERQQAERALLKAQEEAKRREQEAEAAQQATSKFEQELQLAESARFKAEEEAKRKAQEIETEREAKRRRELELQLAEKARVKAEEEAEQRVKQAESEQARIKAELDRQHEKLLSFQSQGVATSGSIRFCPICTRVFSANQVNCLYDAAALLDGQQLKALAASKSRFTWPVVLLVVITFFVTGISSIVVLNLFSGTQSVAQPNAAVVVPTVKTEEPIVGGRLSGKDALLPSPEYPSRARSERVSGKVTVGVLVNKSGTVTSASALDGHPLLQASAVAAAKKAKFPEQANQGTATSGTITYSFKL